MSVLVYNGERFQRGKVWYLLFAVIFASVFLLSLLNGNIVGSVLLFFLLGGYFYYSTTANQVITMSLQEGKLMIGAKIYPLTDFTGYALEIHPKTQLLKNIVFVTAKGHMIYSFDDTPEHIKAFLLDINAALPMLGEFHQSFFERLSRKCKL